MSFDAQTERSVNQPPINVYDGDVVLARRWIFGRVRDLNTAEAGWGDKMRSTVVRVALDIMGEVPAVRSRADLETALADLVIPPAQRTPEPI